MAALEGSRLIDLQQHFDKHMTESSEASQLRP
jgi:hypothetical protein